MKTLTTVIPVYNGEKYIAATLRSVAQQTRRPDRLIVLDNCSTDGTQRIVEQFKDLPCEWRQNEKNLGLFGNSNRALRFAAETEYLHLLHADDLVLPGFYQRSMAELAPVRGRAMSYCRSELIDENGAVVREAAPVRPAASRYVPVREFIAAQSELRRFYWPGVLLKTGGQAAPCAFREDILQLADQLFWAEWAAHCEGIVELREVLCQYRVHPANETARNASSLQAWVLDEWKVMQLITTRLEETGLAHWLREQRLKCVLAARSQVKIKQVRRRSPEFAAEIRGVTRRIVGAHHWLLGNLAVWVRDSFSPAAPA